MWCLLIDPLPAKALLLAHPSARLGAHHGTREECRHSRLEWDGGRLRALGSVWKVWGRHVVGDESPLSDLWLAFCCSHEVITIIETIIVMNIILIARIVIVIITLWCLWWILLWVSMIVYDFYLEVSFNRGTPGSHPFVDRFSMK